MRNKLTNKVFIVATILASVFTLFFGIYEYRREHAFRVDILHSQLQLNNYQVAQRILLRGKDSGTSEKMPHQSDLDGSAIRVTIIDTLGNVVYDTEGKDVRQMGNHLLREEIQEALDNGSGYAIKRASETNGEKYFYSATLFKDSLPTDEVQGLAHSDSLHAGKAGNFNSSRACASGGRGFIVRSSVAYSAELTSSLEHDYTFFYYTASILALIAIALYFRSRFEHSEREKQRIKRQLTENAAHELKTPAATIEGYLETLVSTPTMSKDKQMEFLEKCHAQSRRMSRLLADMSTLTRLDEAHIVRPRSRIDAAAIMRQIKDETAAQFREQNVHLQIQIPQTMPMNGDASLVYSLFRNIFSNALTYATDATYFKVSARSSGGRYKFTFVDNGVGVPVEHLSHIFERFYRIDKGRSRRLGGTGLGLAIVKNIALQYGGSVVASPTTGGGLTITVELSEE